MGGWGRQFYFCNFEKPLRQGETESVAHLNRLQQESHIEMDRMTGKKYLYIKLRSHDCFFICPSGYFFSFSLPNYAINALSIIMKVYIERNNLQLKIIRYRNKWIFCRSTFAKRFVAMKLGSEIITGNASLFARWQQVLMPRISGTPTLMLKTSPTSARNVMLSFVHSWVIHTLMLKTSPTSARNVMLSFVHSWVIHTLMLKTSPTSARNVMLSFVHSCVIHTLMLKTSPTSARNVTLSFVHS